MGNNISVKKKNTLNLTHMMEIKRDLICLILPLSHTMTACVMYRPTVNHHATAAFSEVQYTGAKVDHQSNINLTFHILTGACSYCSKAIQV